MINKIGLGGVFDITVLDNKGNVKQKNESKNLIVDAWLNEFCSQTGVSSNVNLNPNSPSSSWGLFTQFKVGTGSNNPLLTDTDLQAPVATVTTSAADTVSVNYLYDADSDSFVYTMSRTMPFALGAVVANISEVGVWSLTTSFGTNPRLFSRALIKDGFGNPTTITVTAEDQLVITYTLTFVMPRTLVGSFILNENTYNFEIKKSQAGFSVPFNEVLGVRLASSFNAAFLIRATDVAFPLPTVSLNTVGFDQIGAQINFPSVVNTNQSARRTRFRIPLSTGNYAGGIACMAWQQGNGHYWLMKFSPFIPKTNQQLFELEFATEFVRL
jgi:hypothetical protein